MIRGSAPFGFIRRLRHSYCSIDRASSLREYENGDTSEENDAMPQIIIHTMQHLCSVVMHARKAGGDRMLMASLFLLLPLSLGWPLIVWLTGGRGSTAASCLVITIWRAVSCAIHSDCDPSTGGKPLFPSR
jgi:hypothetical protein